jgi:hypothetical protein
MVSGHAIVSCRMLGQTGMNPPAQAIGLRTNINSARWLIKSHPSIDGSFYRPMKSFFDPEAHIDSAIGTLYRLRQIDSYFKVHRFMITLRDCIASCVFRIIIIIDASGL